MTVWLVFLLGGANGELFGQDPDSSKTEAEDSSTRTGEWETLRKERLATVKPAKRNKAVEILATFENDGFDQLVTVQTGDWRVGFGKISPISSFTPAVRYERPRIGETELTFRASGAYSARGFQVYNVQFGNYDDPVPYEFVGAGFLGAPFNFDYRAQERPQRFLYVDTRYRNFPQEDFYGLGNDSLKGQRTDYRYEEGGFDIVGGFQPVRWLAFSGRTGLLTTNVGRGTHPRRTDTQDFFDESSAPGLTDQPNYLFALGSVNFGWQYDPNQPSGEIGLTAGRVDQTSGNRFQFYRYSFDARGFLPLGSRQRVLASRLYFARDIPDSGSEVPFYAMNTLGGSNTLRGYRDFRFRDRGLIHFSGEYRWEATSGVELAAFYDTGKVFADRSGLTFSGWKHGYGVGLRVKNLRRVALRFDIGHSEEGTILYLSFGPSF